MLREISGRENERITNTLFYEFITHVMRTYYRCEKIFRVREVKDSHVFVTSVENSHEFFIDVTNTFTLFTLVTDSFDFHIRTNLSHM